MFIKIVNMKYLFVLLTITSSVMAAQIGTQTNNATNVLNNNQASPVVPVNNNLQNVTANNQQVVTNNPTMPTPQPTVDIKKLQEEYSQKLIATNQIDKDFADNIFSKILECENITDLIEQYTNLINYAKQKNNSDLSGYTFYKLASNKDSINENIKKLLAKELSKATTKHRTLSIQKKKVYNYELPLFANQISEQFSSIASNNINNFFSSFDNFKKSFDETLAMSNLLSRRKKEKKLKLELHNGLDMNYVLKYIADKNPYIETILKSYLIRIMHSDGISHYYDLYWIMARTGIVLEAVMKQKEMPDLYKMFFNNLKERVQGLDLVRLIPDLEAVECSDDDDDNPDYKAKFSKIIQQSISGLIQTDTLGNNDKLIQEYLKSIMLLRNNKSVDVLNWVFPDMITKFGLNNTFNYNG
ncbi:MAG: hypothetical protein IJU54_01875 [Alphaproteobacteria bacterium]|nr:hypothetical protein [Alphaproteobacteria bacterium]